MATKYTSRRALRVQLQKLMEEDKKMREDTYMALREAIENYNNESLIDKLGDLTKADLKLFVECIDYNFDHLMRMVEKHKAEMRELKSSKKSSKKQKNVEVDNPSQGEISQEEDYVSDIDMKKQSKKSNLEKQDVNSDNITQVGDDFLKDLKFGNNNNE